jgi:septal ring factor EnvC (AmiA/AmiB activator)
MKGFWEIVLLLAAIAAIVVLSMRSRAVEHERDAARREACEALEALETLRGQCRSAEDRCGVLADDVASYSNRLREAETGVAREHDTNDALRRQIETMLSQTVGLEAQVRKKDKELETWRTMCEKAEKRVKELERQEAPRVGPKP